MENQITLNTTYGEFRDTLKNELQKSAEGFVRIGYLLKMARDSDILKYSRYMTVNDFAKGEFGLTKDQVSRFIAINERFSEGGNSDRLDEKYTAFGYAKLTEILTLPDEVIDTLSPELTRREIQDVKKDIKEEEKISDLEVLMEGQKEEQQELNNLQKVLHQYFYDNRKDYLNMKAVIESASAGAEETEHTFDVLAPSGIAVKTVRIRGVGLFMVSFKGKDNPVELLNTRTNEKEEHSWSDFISSLQDLFNHKAGKKEWSEEYGEPYEEPVKKPEEKPEEKPEVAPVQQRPEESEAAAVPKTLHDIEESIPEPEPVPEPEPEPEKEPEENPDEQIEEQVKGQTSIEENFPEYMPEPEETVEEPEGEDWINEIEDSIHRISTMWEEGTYFKELLEEVRSLESKLEKVVKAGGQNEE